MTEDMSLLIVLRSELHDDSEWFSSRSFKMIFFEIVRICKYFYHQWSQKLKLSGSYVDAEASSQWKSHQCKSRSSVRVAFTSAMSMTVIEWKCWKVRWQKIEEWARMRSRLLIDRLSEACQDRSLLETSAQPILHLLLYVTSIVLLVMQWQSFTSFNKY